MFTRIFNTSSRLTIFSVARNNITFRACSKNTFTKTANNDIFHKLSEVDKINYAIAEDNPPTGEVAFYKGRGLEKLGKGYAGEALNAFELAEKMDPSYHEQCRQKIANIYAGLGQFEKAYVNLSEAYREAKKLKNQTPEVRQTENNEPQPYLQVAYK